MKEFKIVLAGCGGISKAWLNAIKSYQSAKMVGFVDINIEAARERRDEFGYKDAVIDTNLRKVLKQLKPDIVFDCTIPEAHCSVVLEAVKAGCNVLGEKPLADTMKNAKKMVQAAKKQGAIYAVMQNRRFDPNIRAIRELINKGIIGEVHTLHSDFFIGAHFGGFRDKMKHVLLLDMAIHTFDAARFLLQADPISVFAKDWNPVGSWYADGASASCFFEMADGKVYTYRGSWCAEGNMTKWEAQWRIIGTKGTIVWDGARNMKVEVIKEPPEQTGLFYKLEEVPVELPPPAEGSWHQLCIMDFLKALEENRTPETICTDNIKSLAMVLSAIESAEKRKIVRIRL